MISTVSLFNVRQLLVWPWFIKYGVSQLTDHWLLLLISCLNADSFFQSYCFCFCTVTISFENPRLELLKHIMSGLVHDFCFDISNYSTSVGSTVQCLLINHCLYSNHWSLLKAVISMTDKCLLAGSSADTAPPTLDTDSGSCGHSHTQSRSRAISGVTTLHCSHYSGGAPPTISWTHQHSLNIAGHIRHQTKSFLCKHLQHWNKMFKKMLQGLLCLLNCDSRMIVIEDVTTGQHCSEGCRFWHWTDTTTIQAASHFQN